jgi:hypothetical protein
VKIGVIMKITSKYTGDRTTKWICWIARVWGALIVVYVLLVIVSTIWNWLTTGIADQHAIENINTIEYVGPVFIFISTLGLGIAWRWVKIGGTVAVVFQLLFIVFHLFQKPISLDPSFIVPFLISIIIFFPGILFLVCWWRQRKRS